MPYFEKIPGERIYLSPINPDDAELYTKWLNDLEITRWLGSTGSVFSLPAERAWLDGNLKDTNNYQFAIVLRDGDNLRGGDRLIGGTGFHDINQVNRRATLGIFIGGAEDRSKGYGAEALRLLVGYGFKWLGLLNIDLHVHSGNARAIRCYEKAGFRTYGRRSGVIFYDGGWMDDVLMEVLAKDWLDQA